MVIGELMLWLSSNCRSAIHQLPRASRNHKLSQN